MASAVGGLSYLATAQTGRAPVKMTAPSGASAAGGAKLKTLADLPAMVEAYGRAQGVKKQAAKGRSALAIGNGASGFNLLEDDLTSNSNSDDREPIISPGGDFIAFASTGKDSNGDGKLDADAENTEGKYHIWVMGRNGSNVRQVTGLFAGEDKNRNQRRPAWSPDGNQLAYVDGDGNATELFVAQPFTDVDLDTAGTQVGRSERRTFFNDPTPRVTLQSPAWSPSGQFIVFAANANPNPNSVPNGPGNPFNLFAISPTGDLGTLARLTGGAGDVPANATATETVNDLNPTFSTTNSDVIYFSSNRDATGRITGRRIWRIFADGSSKLQVTDSLQRDNGRLEDIDDFPSSSIGSSSIFGGASESLSFQSNSYIDASDATANGSPDFNIWSLPVPVPNTTPLETADAALVNTNILSSPDNYTASGIAPTNGSTDNVGQDKAPDVEPAFSRNGSTPENTNALVFASTRRFAPVPGSNRTGDNGVPPSAANPFGAGTGDKYDIWGTTTADTTQPILIPQASGNQLFPVVAPGPQSPFLAPRTAETGLRAGNNVTIAVVLSDQQSGLNTSVGSTAVVASIRRAGTENFTPLTPLVNEALPVQIQREGRADVEDTVPLQPFDDGPVSNGGNEAQAGAVAGDGIYYCVGSLKTSTSAGDFYIDVNVSDQATPANIFNYDNIWGYSTRTFNKLGPTSSLFVSDYTTGQTFPFRLELSNDRRFANEVPTESYYLTNNGGQVVDPMISDNSFPTTFNNVDVWRTLSRGAVPTTVLDTYKPRVAQQISSNPADDPTFTRRTRNVAVAPSYVAWAAPYAANSFVGPGTITDPTTQGNLTAFLSNGGRLFVTGRDVAFALSNGSSGTNNFLSDELSATLTGETATNNIDLVGGVNNSLVLYPRIYPETYYDLQLADRPYVRDDVNNDRYSDAAISQQPTISASSANSNGAGVRVDLITPGENATPVYAVGGATVGQKIQRTRTNGLESRAIFFSFGLEGINRRYRKPTSGFPLIALDTRLRIALGLDRYFLTNTMKGSVINDRTNLPIPNFLVRVTTSQGEIFLARTDATGNYEVTGLPPQVDPEAFTVEPAFLLNGRLVSRTTTGAQTSPSGFFGGTPIRLSIAGNLTGTANLRPIPFSPGTIRGRVVTSKGTPNVFTDDLPLSQKAVEMTVLLRSIDATPLTSNGGRYAQLTKTNFNGDFTFSNVPAGIQLEVVFNPRKNTAIAPAYNGDTPKESNLDATQSAPKPDVGRRVIPDQRRPDPIISPAGNTFFLNDPDPVKYPDPDFGPAVGSADADKSADSGVPLVIPEGANIAGKITLNGVVFKGAKVELLSEALAVLRVKSSTSAGLYSFTDVVPGTYIVRATAKLPDGVEVFRSSSKLVVANKDLNYDFKLFLAKVSGLVTLNGVPQSGVFVQLLSPTGTPVVLTGSNGKAFNLVRTATTDSGKTTNYSLLNVPPGKYTIRASFVGAAGTAAITVGNSKDLVVPTINLTPQKLSGIINLRVDGKDQGAAVGAVVELLDSSGKSLNPAVTTVSGAQGDYSFNFISAGTYQVRASFKGDTATSAVFTLTNGVDPKINLTIDLQTVTVTILNPQGGPQSGATVTISKAGVLLQTKTTDGSGKVIFTEVPGGSYTISATKDDLGQTANNVAVTEGQALSLSLQLVIGGSGGVTFAPNGIYPFSLPYTTDSQAVRVNQAFVLPIATSSGAKNYRIYFFDAAAQINKPILPPTLGTDFKEITDGTTRLFRGQGYVLQTFSQAVSTRTPTQRPDLMPLSGNTFSIPLTWNSTFLSATPEPDNRNNGYNLIGFPFDPGKFRSVSFADSQVRYGATLYDSLEKAAAAGIIDRQLYTLDSSGTRVALDINNRVLRPFQGYFVRILRKDQDVSLILRNPS